jgi:Fur family transcriptional regulator, ferric uptake regulator
MTDNGTIPGVDTWLERLQANGYRLTEPRRAVVETIAASRRLLSPLDVYEQAREAYPSIGLVTVYRTLEKLEELGLVQRVHRPTGCQSFVASAPGHHHLLICRDCGSAEYFSGENEMLGRLMEEVAAASGYTIHEHWLQLFGVCAACQNDTLID